MKKPYYLRLAIQVACTLFLIFTSGCNGSSNTPTLAAVSLTPLIAGPSPRFCESQSIGEMVRGRKGEFMVSVSANGWGNTNTLYRHNNTLSNGNNTIESGGQSWEQLDIGSSSTSDNLAFAVPQKNNYDVTFAYLEYGATKPTGSNANCANLQQNNQPGCVELEISLSFKRKVIPNTSTVINFNVGPWSNGGFMPSCAFF